MLLSKLLYRFMSRFLFSKQAMLRWNETMCGAGEKQSTLLQHFMTGKKMFLDVYH